MGTIAVPERLLITIQDIFIQQMQTEKQKYINTKNNYMKSSIYILNKSDMLEERINMKEQLLKLPKYLTVVYKSSNGEMGFIQDKFGIDYILEYLLGTILWDQRKKEFIELYSKSDILDYMNKINGLTFFDDNINLTKIKDQVKLIQSINRKNTIKSRYGKPVQDVPNSPILEYLCNDKISIKNIIQLRDKLERLIIWDWGEFGLYFHIISHDFSKEIDKIESICKNLNIQVLIKNNEDEVPSW